MAFSYSDKNFTVIGNLCFVHILIHSKDEIYDIPQAIVDRMILKQFKCIYWSYSDEGDSFGMATINSGSISFEAFYDNGYVMFFFPIDSNK